MLKFYACIGVFITWTAGAAGLVYLLMKIPGIEKIAGFMAVPIILGMLYKIKDILEDY